MIRCSICDPLKKEPIEIGEIEREKALDVFDKFPWNEMIDKMKGVKPTEINWAPSIEFENKENQHGINISIVDDGTEFYIFFKRPKLVDRFFGLSRKVNENFTSDRTGQTIADAREAVKALIEDDIATLEMRWG